MLSFKSALLVCLLLVVAFSQLPAQNTPSNLPPTLDSEVERRARELLRLKINETTTPSTAVPPNAKRTPVVIPPGQSTQVSQPSPASKPAAAPAKAVSAPAPAVKAATPKTAQVASSTPVASAGSVSDAKLRELLRQKLQEEDQKERAAAAAATATQPAAPVAPAKPSVVATPPPATPVRPAVTPGELPIRGQPLPPAPTVAAPVPAPPVRSIVAPPPANLTKPVPSVAPAPAPAPFVKAQPAPAPVPEPAPRALAPEVEARARELLRLKIEGDLAAATPTQPAAPVKAQTVAASSALDGQKEAAARDLLRQKIAAAAAATPQVKPAVANNTTPSKLESVNLDPSRPKSKMERLAEITILYKADQMTPREYHQKRAEIIAEP